MAEITSLTELKIMAEGDIIGLPRFKEDMPFNARVKRVSLLSLIQKGVIPNTLLSAAEELFYGKKASKDVDMAQITKVMTTMAEETLVQPSIQDIRDAGLELNDEQLVALFNYCQQGIKQVTPSNKESEDNVDSSNSQSISSETKSDNQSN